MNTPQQRNTFWIIALILIILSIFVPNYSSWYFPVNLVTLVVIYIYYFIMIKSQQYGWAIFEAAISAIWFDSYFKAPFGSPKTIAMFFGIVGVILMVIAIILDIQQHRQEKM
ncbi:hypothetical protein [Lactobacillus sp.]|uniref:hypothetical protein n=1 Tax=Lactobacillus sp. TaxID=1591 RepID=UPI0019C53FDA|nr:hypothetical protein [Lactobacillus sp.]MBD5429410.1 hypothetical protein [Lactobacillus sp.]MBD5430844.1 hypothetical protein [Lactobacillus sp.]